MAHQKKFVIFVMKKTDWRKSMNVGTIAEFSKKDSTYFGLIEIDDGIRVLGEISCSSDTKYWSICLRMIGII